MQEAPPQPASTRRWSPRSLTILVLAWLILQIGGLFTPGLLDDVDSVYIEIAREMMQRHDYVTPYINGIRFFDKPPLLYWMAAGSMHVFGIHDWAARLPLALAARAHTRVPHVRRSFIAANVGSRQTIPFFDNATELTQPRSPQ